MSRPSLFSLSLCLLCGLCAFAASPARADNKLNFSRDIHPILSENCFQCHGPDEKARKAKLRLDTQEGARAVVTARKGQTSELVRRINAGPEDGLMPPHRTGRQLSVTQRELLRRWVEEGAA